MKRTLATHALSILRYRYVLKKDWLEITEKADFSRMNSASAVNSEGCPGRLNITPRADIT